MAKFRIRLGIRDKVGEDKLDILNYLSYRIEDNTTLNHKISCNPSTTTGIWHVNISENFNEDFDDELASFILEISDGDLYKVSDIWVNNVTKDVDLIVENGEESTYGV